MSKTRIKELTVRSLRALVWHLRIDVTSVAPTNESKHWSFTSRNAWYIMMCSHNSQWIYCVTSIRKYHTKARSDQAVDSLIRETGIWDNFCVVPSCPRQTGTCLALSPVFPDLLKWGLVSGIIFCIVPSFPRPSKMCIISRTAFYVVPACPPQQQWETDISSL